MDDGSYALIIAQDVPSSHKILLVVNIVIGTVLGNKRPLFNCSWRDFIFDVENGEIHH